MRMVKLQNNFETHNSFTKYTRKYIMSELLKQAIADAKAVRATALSNAKAYLEEAFTPKLQSMLGEKLRQEVEDSEIEELPQEQPPVEAPIGDEGGLSGEAPAPTEDPAMDVPQMDVAPVEPAIGQDDEEVDEALLGQGNPDPVEQTFDLTETDKASPDYKKTTSGHKTEDPGKKMVVDAKKLSTAGEPKAAAAGSRKASTDYTKTTSGEKTQDPQGASNEVSKGPSKSEKNATGKTLEEGEEEIPDESLEEIVRELEQEISAGQSDEAPQFDSEEPKCDDDDVEINIDELLNSEDDVDPTAPAPMAESKDDDADDKKEEKDEDEDEEKKKNLPPWLQKENISLKKELAEYRSTVNYLRDRINEVNLLNAKLLYTNKLFKQANMTNEQKLKVIESFDLTKSVREAKIVYATLAESINSGARKTVEQQPVKKTVSSTVRSITEGLASKVVGSTKPTKTVITEGTEMANRFMKLAGIQRK